MASSSPVNNGLEESRVNTSPSRERYIVLADIPEHNLLMGDVIENKPSGYVVINRFLEEYDGRIRPVATANYERIGTFKPIPISVFVTYKDSLKEAKDKLNEMDILRINMKDYSTKNRPEFKNRPELRKDFLTLLNSYVKKPPAPPASSKKL